MGSSRCAAHPSKKHRYAQGAEIEYAADMSVALAYHKCLDDWHDDGSRAGKICSSALEGAYNRVKALHPNPCEALERELSAIKVVEGSLSTVRSEGYAQLDDAMAEADGLAKQFGRALGIVFSDGCSQWQRELFAFGSEIGRFIYFMDAELDRGEDAKSGAFNPFNLCDVSDDDAEVLLENVLGRAANVFERLPLERDLNLMRSILYAGVWQRLRSKRRSGEGGEE